METQIEAQVQNILEGAASEVPLRSNQTRRITKDIA